ncbi:Kinesin-like protein KIN-12E [Chlorella vulgaris]
MTRPDTSLDTRRMARSTTPATSPRRQPLSNGTPRKGSRAPSATPGHATPGAARTPFRSRSGIPSLTALSERRRANTRGVTGIHSEPSSPRAAPACPGLADSLPSLPSTLDYLLPPGDDSTCGSDNVKVYVRVRPLNTRGGSGDGGPAAKACLTCPPGGGRRTVLLADASRSEPYTATFDRVFGPEEGQQQVFEAVGAQLVENCMAGINSSLFVYGQTGAGKTHTITGEVERGAEDGAVCEDTGLTLRIFRQLFDRITEDEHDGVRFTVKCYNCEVYGEEVTDLLAPGASGLQIRDGDQHQGIYVEGLSEHVVVNADDVMQLIQRGSANRHTAATRMNERSSRSHSVFTAVVEAHEEQGESGVTHVQFAKMNLIDLAGSERVGKSGATGDRLTEAKGINKSLTTLGRVVSALTERQQHVPYRDSRLTFLLKESLGGNAKTSIVACVSPSEDSAQETHSTLVFAAGAKRIKNRAVVNENTVGDMKALQLENARLQRELAKREDVLAAELRQHLAAAQGEAAGAEQRAAVAEERQQQLEVALTENHVALQQRNAELAMVKKEAEDTKSTCQLLQKDREGLIDHNAALTERVDGLQGSLQRSKDALRQSQQELAIAKEHTEAAIAAQRAAEDSAHSHEREKERLADDVARVSAELAESKTAQAASEQANKALRREVDQLTSDLRRRQREVQDTQELAAEKEGRLRREIEELSESVASRSAQLQELEGQLASETVCTTKYRRMVGEIGKLIDWAHSTSPLPPTLGGRTSPAGYSSVMGFGSSRSFGGGGSSTIAVSPLGDATNMWGLPGSASRRASTSPSKQRQMAARTLLAMAALATLALSTNAALPELANPGGPPFLSAYWKFEDAETGGLWSVGVHNNSTFGAAEYYEGIYASSGVYTSWECGPEPGSYFAIANATYWGPEGAEAYTWCEYGVVDLDKGIIMTSDSEEECSTAPDHYHTLTIISPISTNENTCGTPTTLPSAEGRRK